jgi:hypothetical protein
MNDIIKTELLKGVSRLEIENFKSDINVLELCRVGEVNV